MGVIEKVYKDEDVLVEGSSKSPPVFIIDVRFQGARGYFNLDHVWVADRVYRTIEKVNSNNLLEVIEEDQEEDGVAARAYSRPLSNFEELLEACNFALRSSR